MSHPRSELLMAYRWPAAVFASSVVLGSALLVMTWMVIRFLSAPIPIRIEGGLDVDRLVMPATLTIRADQPLPVQGGVVVKEQVQISGAAPLPIRGPITVREIASPLQASVTVQEQLNVDAKVRVEGQVNVTGDVDAKVKPRL